MEFEEFVDRMNLGEAVTGGGDLHLFMRQFTQESMELTCRMNNTYCTLEEVRELFSQLIGKPVDEGFILFPPFYTNFGKNINLGKKVFINAGCHFQDQGGITIGDEAIIGNNVVLCTMNHDFDPDKRRTTYPSPIVIGKHVWIGSNVTIVPGVTVGNGAILGAGAVVTRDVPENTVVVGSPARVIRRIVPGAERDPRKRYRPALPPEKP